jgi:hypothetical protein
VPTLAGAFPKAPDNYRPEYFPFRAAYGLRQGRVKGAIKKIVRRDVGDYVPGGYSGPARCPDQARGRSTDLVPVEGKLRNSWFWHHWVQAFGKAGDTVLPG